MTARALPATIDVPEPVVAIVRTLESAGHEAWCVGGALRDAVLGLPHSDFDVATSAPPPAVRGLFRRTVPVGERFGTIGVLDPAGTLHEVTTFRRDVSTDGRHAVVAFGVSLDDDLARRDFTINAIAYHPLRAEWRDPWGGAGDLAAGTIRAVGVAGERFREDYLRVLRALRFAARFGFAIVPETWSALQAAAPGLGALSAERVRDEWFKGLATCASVARLVTLWREAGAATAWLPGLADPGALHDAALSAHPRDPVLLTACLLPQPAEVLRRLRASNAEIARAAAIARGPAEPAGDDDASVRRWLAATGDAADDLLAAWRLTHGVVPGWTGQVVAVRARGDAVSRRELQVSGTDLMALGITGAAVGRTLDRLLDRVLEDPTLNRRDILLSLAAEPA
jgi:tRNA nucleotidyltransferase (CCA-adding enzyme)